MALYTLQRKPGVNLKNATGSSRYHQLWKHRITRRCVPQQSDTWRQIHSRWRGRSRYLSVINVDLSLGLRSESAPPVIRYRNSRSVGDGIFSISICQGGREAWFMETLGERGLCPIDVCQRLGEKGVIHPTVRARLTSIATDRARFGRSTCCSCPAGRRLS